MLEFFIPCHEGLEFARRSNQDKRPSTTDEASWLLLAKWALAGELIMQKFY